MGIHFHSFCLLLYLCHVWDNAAFWLTIFKKKIVWRKRISESISGVLAMKNGRLRYFWMIFTRMIESSVKNLKTLDNGLNLGLLRSQKNPENLQEFPSQDFSKFLKIFGTSRDCRNFSTFYRFLENTRVFIDFKIQKTQNYPEPFGNPDIIQNDQFSSKKPESRMKILLQSSWNYWVLFGKFHREMPSSWFTIRKHKMTLT